MCGSGRTYTIVYNTIGISLSNEQFASSAVDPIMCVCFYLALFLTKSGMLAFVHVFIITYKLFPVSCKW